MWSKGGPLPLSDPFIGCITLHRPKLAVWLAASAFHYLWNATWIRVFCGGLSRSLPLWALPFGHFYAFFSPRLDISMVTGLSQVWSSARMELEEKNPDSKYGKRKKKPGLLCHSFLLDCFSPLLSKPERRNGNNDCNGWMGVDLNGVMLIGDILISSNLGVFY